MSCRSVALHVWGAIHLSTILALVAVGLSSGRAQSIQSVVPPPNDMFANRILLSGTNVSVAGSNLGATAEGGEPTLLGWKSVWYGWVAEHDGPVSVRIDGSGASVGLGVFQGASPNTNVLKTVASGMFASTANREVFFLAKAGSEYQVGVGAYNGWSGAFVLLLNQYPTNDSFNNPVILEGTDSQAFGLNFGATAEPGELEHSLVPGESYTNSVWWAWTPASSGSAEIVFPRTAFTSVLRLYAGDVLTNLVHVDGTVLYLPTTSDWVYSFNAVGGRTHRIAVAGKGGAAGRIGFRLRQQPGNTLPTIAPINEQRGVPGQPVGPIRVQIDDAETSSDLLKLEAVSPYSWVVNTKQITLGGQGRERTLSISQLGTNTGVAPIYLLLTDANGGRTSSKFDLRILPANNDFANATLLVGTNAVSVGTTRYATREPGEPNHNGVDNAVSCWWKWTAPNSGEVFAQVRNLEKPTDVPGLAIYLGSSVSNLTCVNSNLFLSPATNGMVGFTAQEARTYFVCVSGIQGLMELRLWETPGNRTPVISEIFDQVIPPGVSSGAIPIQLADDTTPVDQLELSALSSPTWQLPATALTFGGAGSNRTLTIKPLNTYDSGIVEVRVRDREGAFSVRRFTVSVAVPKDDMTQRLLVTGSNLRILGNNSKATKDANELDHARQPGGKSMWLDWSAPADGWVEMSTDGSSFDTILAVYNSFTEDFVCLFPIVGNDQSPAGGNTSRVRFCAKKGGAYSVAVDGYRGATGDFVLSIRQPVQNAGLRGSSQGGVTVREFHDLQGASLSQLTNSAYYPWRPDRVSVAGYFEWPRTDVFGDSMRDNYGTQLMGYFVPEVSGAYVFALAADDSAELYLSRDEDPAYKQVIAREVNPHFPRAFSSTSGRRLLDPGTPKQRLENFSLPMELSAGRRYYIEAVAKENLGIDGLAVAVQIPGARAIRSGDTPIPGALLATMDKHLQSLTITHQPTNVTVQEGHSAYFSLEVEGVPPFHYSWSIKGAQWQKVGDKLSNYPQLVLEKVSMTNDLAVVQAVVRDASNLDYLINPFLVNPFGIVTSAPVTLHVIADVEPPRLLSAQADETGTNLVLRFSEPLDSVSATNLANYHLEGGLSILGVSLLPSNDGVIIATDPQVAGTRYRISAVGVKDRSAAGNASDTTCTTEWSAWVLSKGVVKIDYYDGVNGSDVLQLITHTNFPNRPTASEYRSSLESSYERGDNYGARARGWLIPPRTGEYTFYFTSDNQGVFMLSTDDQQLNVTMVASEPVASGPRDWLSKPEHRSSPLAMEAGKSYYFEVLQKENTGLDHFAVTWTGPGLPDLSAKVPAIASEFIANYVNPDDVHFSLLEQPVPVSCLPGETAVFQVSVESSHAVFYQWMRNGVDLVGENRSSLTIPSCGLADDGARYQVRMVAPLVSTNSSEVVLRVLSDTIPPVFAASAIHQGSDWELTVAFSEAVDPAQAETASNYELGAVEWVDGPRYLPRSAAVVIRVKGLVEGQTYPLVVRNVQDLSGNMIQQVEGHYTAQSLAWTQVGGQKAGLAPTVAAKGPRSFDIYSAAWEATGSTEEATFVYETVTGDFDKCVRIRSQDPASPWSGVGLTARESLSEGQTFEVTTPPFGRSIRIQANSKTDYLGLPARDKFEMTWRPWEGTGYRLTSTWERWDDRPQYPEVWLRLKRVGRSFWGWYSHDGVDWMLADFRELPYQDSALNTLPPLAESLYVGIEYCPDTTRVAPEAVALFQAQVSDYGDTLLPPAILLQPEDLVLKQGDKLVLQAAAAGTEPVRCQWWWNGSALAGGTNPVLSLPCVSPAVSGAYFLVASNALGNATSRVAQVTVNVPEESLLRLGQILGAPGPEFLLPVFLVGRGQEHTIGFSLAFDPQMVAFKQVIPGPAARAGTLQEDDFLVANGRVGVSLTLPVGHALEPGEQILVYLAFHALPGASATPVDFAFDDQPIARSLGSVSYTPIAMGTEAWQLPLDKPTPAVWTDELAPFVLPAAGRAAPQVGKALTFQIETSPPGIVIDSATGILRWTPGEMDGPSSNRITVHVTASGQAGVLATEQVDVMVREVNSAPVFDPVPDQHMLVGDTLSMPIPCRDPDWPENQLTFGLLDSPIGATIDPGTGLFTWTPTHAPSVSRIQVVAIDDGSPPLRSTNAFEVVVSERNHAPTLGYVADQTVNEMTPLVLHIQASDPDVPTNRLTFSLVESPEGANITPDGGVFTWTPTEAQAPSTNVVVVRVSDDGVPALSSTLQFTVVVNEVNRAPIFEPLADQTLSEMSQFVLSAKASDPDIPTNRLTYSLVSCPEGAAINPDEGVFAWTPTEAQGPSTNVVAVRVSDDGLPPLSTTNLFRVVVVEVNLTPVVAKLDDKVVDEGTLLSFAVTATDPDLPAQPLSFSLDGDAPANASITREGLFTWTPTEAQGPGTNLVTFGVSDGLAQVTQTIQIVVNEVNQAPVLPVQVARMVEALQVLTVTNTATDPDIPSNLLTYQLMDPPQGAAIDTNGVITWTPTKAQSPSTNLITSVVSDNGTPTLSSTNQFAVVAVAVNSPPLLMTVEDKMIHEGTLLSFTVTATDPDLPAQPLSFSLGSGAPTNASITREGLFTWTPTDAQGPSTNVITVQVSDGLAQATQAIQIVVNEVNQAPVLPVQVARMVEALQVLTVTNTAMDLDIPANVLNYQLLDPPLGAAIDTNGVITWTPTKAQSPSTNLITSVVSDNGTPPLSSTNQLEVVVFAANQPPVLALIGNKVVDEGVLLSFAIKATDPDLPAQPLAFSLGSGAPTGATLTRDGLFTWTPTETQGPSTNLVPVQVSDGLAQVTQTIQIVVNEVNQAPVMPVQAARMVEALKVLMVTNTAMDADIPVNLLTYRLLDPPLGAAIDTNGVITWTPAEAQALSTNLLITVVTDDGVPPLSSSNQITVVVSSAGKGAPVILAGPADTTVLQGETTVLSVVATGRNPLSYRWLKSGTAINGATNNTLSFQSAQITDSGFYRAVVSNADGSTNTSSAFLGVVRTNNPTVNTIYSLRIWAQLDGQSDLVISSNAVRWHHLGATRPGLHTTPPEPTRINGTNWTPKWPDISTTAPAWSSTFSNLIVNFRGTVYFDAISARTKPVLLSQPSVANGFTTTLEFNDTLASHGYYEVVLKGLGPPLGQPPIIRMPPQDATVLVGGTASFSVTADGTQPLYYQWRHDGTNLVGAQETVLILSPVQVGDGGNYDVVVTNAWGNAKSSLAQLTVLSQGRFTSLVYSQTTGLIFTFSEATPGRFYRIQTSTSLEQGSWVDWKSFLYEGPIVLTNSIAPAAEKHFYRVVSP